MIELCYNYSTMMSPKSLDDNYFSIHSAQSWKEIAENMHKMPSNDVTIEPMDDGLAELARAQEHGQLALDIYQTPSDVIVEAPIAGVKPEDLDISINNDVLTIKGQRKRSKKLEKEDLLYHEVHWGEFSRSIILPVDVINDRIEAELKDGILTVRLPKAKKSRSIKVKIGK